MALMCASDFGEAAIELQAAFDVLIQPDAAPERDTIVLVSNLSQALCKQHRVEEARQLCERALSMAQTLYPNGSELLGLVHYNMGMIDEDRGDLEGALRDYSAAAPMLNAFAGARHPETLAAESKLAGFARHFHQYSEAEDAACRVVDDTPDVDRNEGSVGQALAVLAHCAEAAGDTGLAVERWRAAICHMQLDASVAEDEEHALVNLARLRYAANALDEARVLLMSAIDIMRSQREDPPPYVVDALAHVCRVSGRDAEAASYEALLEEHPAHGQ
jgi:tetratricopeptide (TPR) repeat protein